MPIQKLNFASLLFIIFTAIHIHSMEEKPEISKYNDQTNIEYFETLPDELFLLICQFKIHDIINRNDPKKAKDEFKFFLTSICDARKRFHKFKFDLKTYFIKHKKLDSLDAQFEPIYFKPKRRETI